MSRRAQYRDTVEEHAFAQREEAQRHLEEDGLPLFAAPSYDVDTSIEAAESLAPTLGRLRWKVLKAVCESEDGLTTLEAEDLLGLTHQTCSPRIWEMVRKMRTPFLFYSSDLRKGPSGRSAHVVRPTEDGLRFYHAEIEAAA